MDVFLVKSMETIDSRGIAKFDPRGMIGIIYNGDFPAKFIMGTTKHCYIQNIEALGLLFSEKKTFFSFSHCKSMEIINPQGVAKFDPRGMAGTIYVEDH